MNGGLEGTSEPMILAIPGTVMPVVQGASQETEASQVQAGAPTEWIVWQLVDSAFPTGGFAHSAGLEAAWQHGEVRNRTALTAYLECSLDQAGRGGIPVVAEAHRSPDRWDDINAICDAFLNNHVANRASRMQGRALISAYERIMGHPPTLASTAGTAPVHWAAALGRVCRQLGLDGDTAGRLFLFNHLRSLLAAAVRLNIVGPMEAQRLQFLLAARAANVHEECSGIALEALANTSPLLDLWQGAQDRLYSRLFQS